jgi:hypothetical protein
MVNGEDSADSAESADSALPLQQTLQSLHYYCRRLLPYEGAGATVLLSLVANRGGVSLTLPGP